MTVARLRVLLAHHGPDEAFAVAAGRAVAGADGRAPAHGRCAGGLAGSAARRPPDEWSERCRRLGVSVRTARDPDFPEVLRHDPQPPAVLFTRGDLDVLDGRRVGIVGTRNATQAGRDVAHALGRDLAEAGVVVVSGLAKGIDGAAHRGTLGVAGGRPVAVVGNGPDRPYPRVHSGLWDDVCARGPAALRVAARHGSRAVPVPAAQPHPGRPVSEVLVVVESRERGGSLITAQAAIDRGVEVMAVPGSVRNRAANGTNQLLRDGAAPVTGAGDVLVALGLDNRRAGLASYDPRPLPRGQEAAVLERCRRDPCTLDDVVSALGLPIAEAAMALAHLERAGWVRQAGGWFEPVTSWAER